MHQRAIVLVALLVCSCAPVRFREVELRAEVTSDLRLVDCDGGAVYQLAMTSGSASNVLRARYRAGASSDEAFVVELRGRTEDPPRDDPPGLYVGKVTSARRGGCSTLDAARIP